MPPVWNACRGRFPFYYAGCYPGLDEGKDRFLHLSRVIVFFLGITELVDSRRSILIRYDNYIIITIGDLALYELPSFLVRRTEKLHSNRHTVQLQKGFLDLRPFF